MAMENAANKVRVSLSGKEYIITSAEPESYVKELAEEINRQLSAVLSSSPSSSVVDAALLLCMEYLDQSKKSGSIADNFRTQIKDYVEEASTTRHTADTLKRENDTLKRKVQFLEHSLEVKNLKDSLG